MAFVAIIQSDVLEEAAVLVELNGTAIPAVAIFVKHVDKDETGVVGEGGGNIEAAQSASIRLGGLGEELRTVG